MKTYIKPLISEYHVLTSCYLLGGSPGEETKTLTSTQEVIGNHTESSIQQLSKEDSFSAFNLSDTQTDWDE
ncbi:MAG: hypothetical protein HXO36_05765 [Prevotella sp.]|uniref:hypothetical protein n=1 Tax=Prevotella sp. TaxID=59823 RepID=UPI001CAB5B63|nr:hypothetical protein [Prevotella sp.]MBF1613760.1 hypothetical protein [Prevotella sp.]